MSSSSTRVSQWKVWKGISEAEASRQCKKLAWIACTDALPVKSKLLERAAAQDDKCPCCNDGHETVFHALLQCEEVRRFWFASPLGLRTDLLGGVATLSHWINECIDVLDHTRMGMVCAMMWALWHKRSAWFLQQTKLDYEQVLQKATAALLPDDWRPPPEPFVKANFGVLVKASVGTGMGVVYRDSMGAVLASSTKFMGGECFELQIAVALCCIWSMELAGELCFTDVIFETECEEFYNKWNQTQGENIGFYSSYLDSLADDCKMMTEGTGSAITLVPQTANTVAQSLATAAFHHGERVWMEEVPDEASAYLESDFLEFSHLFDDNLLCS